MDIDIEDVLYHIDIDLGLITLYNYIVVYFFLICYIILFFSKAPLYYYILSIFTLCILDLFLVFLPCTVFSHGYH